MSKPTRLFQVAIDGNEANVTNRVGSNVYAFKVIEHLEKITRNNDKFSFTVLLSNIPQGDMPHQRKNWDYQLIKPSFLATQWAIPLHLYLHRDRYDLLFTPSHYAPRFCPIPYITSVMDLAYLHFPEQFRHQDLHQLKSWTKYSVNKAQKVITISEFSKREIVKHYHKDPREVVVAYPSVSFPNKPSLISREKAFFRKHQIKKPYFLYLGTLQPRKNLLNLIEAFERFCRWVIANKLYPRRSRQSGKSLKPRLVIAGKKGWLTKNLSRRIEQSSFRSQIILTGYVMQSLKSSLYQQALASLSVGLYEGFGIPALESLYYGTIPIVANNTSLPEVIGEAGIKVDPYKITEITEALQKIWQLTAKKRAMYRRKAKQQVAKFSWDQTAEIILSTIEVEIKKSK